MIIKYPDLARYLQKNQAPLYMVIGTTSYIAEASIHKIKASWLKQGDCDEKYIHIQQSNEWTDCFQEANHYSLFSPYSLLKIRYEKKTIDAHGLACLKTYLEQPNPRCLILIEAPLLAAKQLQLISKHAHAVLIQALPLAAPAFQLWIRQTLDEKGLSYEAAIPNLIQQYNQNNMLAASQIIEALSLRMQPKQVITPALLSQYLTDQCEYPLFDLAEACLLADANKALHLLRGLNQTKTEPTLVLWLITQEIRILLQWHQLMKQSMPLDAACKQLNIWPQRAKNYNIALQRLNFSRIQQLIIRCHEIDKLIKSAKINEIWHALECLAIDLMRKDCNQEYSR